MALEVPKLWIAESWKDTREKVPMYQLSYSWFFLAKHPQMVTAREDVKALPDLPKGIFHFTRKCFFQILILTTLQRKYFRS